MPYIENHRRQCLDVMDVEDVGTVLEDAGELNYVLSTIVRDYIDRVEPSYASMNAAIGALECCKMEVYRRIIADYEERKITENGDVFT